MDLKLTDGTNAVVIGALSGNDVAEDLCFTETKWNCPHHMLLVRDNPCWRWVFSSCFLTFFLGRWLIRNQLANLRKQTDEGTLLILLVHKPSLVPMMMGLARYLRNRTWVDSARLRVLLISPPNGKQYDEDETLHWSTRFGIPGSQIGEGADEWRRFIQHPPLSRLDNE